MMTDYAVMELTAHPFSHDGLNVGEIEAFYKEAKDKKKAVGILADCCAADKRMMTEFLSKRGLITGTPEYKKPGEKRTKEQTVQELVKLADKGMTTQEAADTLGMSNGTVQNYSQKFGIRFLNSKGSTKKRSEPKGEEAALPPVAKKQGKPELPLQGFIDWQASALEWIQEFSPRADILECRAGKGAAEVKFTAQNGRTFSLRLQLEEG